ncbi:MAG: uroporphyrinogen-III synthase [Sphingomicrobium sp.]
MTRVLVLRPEPGASETVTKARNLGLDAVAVPLFKIEPMVWETPEPGSFDGLLLTSANSIRHGGNQIEQFRGLKVYAVGEATAQAAREAGFDIASTGDAGVDRLLGSIEGDLKLLHLCGDERREPNEPRQPITSVAVYRAAALPAPKLPDEGLALIHSPRAGRRLAELVEDRTQMSLAAISGAAAQAAGDRWKSISVADQPSDDALLALAARLCNNPHPE